MPPIVPTSFQTTNNVAVVGVPGAVSVPAANVETVNATYVTTNNTSGLQAAAIGSTIVYELTNRYQVSVSFSDSSPHTIYTQTLGASPGTFLFSFDLVAYNVTSGLSACYSIKVPINTNGVGATSFPQQFIDFAEQGSMSGVLVTSGAQTGNQFFVTVQGFDASVIDWNLTGYYIQVN